MVEDRRVPTSEGYAEWLEKHGEERLIPLLTQNNEQAMLDELMVWGARGGEGPLVEAAKYGIGTWLIEDDGLLLGVQTRNQAGEIVPTELGKRLAQVYQAPGKKWMVMIDGSALEATEQKPYGARRSLWPDIKGDVDLVLVTAGDYTLEEMRVIMARKNVGTPELGKVSLDYSLTRPRFRRLAIAGGENDCQIAYPEDTDGYAPKNRLLHQVMARGDWPPVVLLVPIFNEKRDLVKFKGVAMAFFPYAHPLIEFTNQGLHRILRPTVIREIQAVFPTGNYPEAYYHFLHTMRTLWSQLFPYSLTENGKPAELQAHFKKLSGGQLLDGRPVDEETCGVLAESSRRTFAWIRENILVPIVQKPERLGIAPAVAQWESKTKQAIKMCFDGDPFLAAYCLTLRPEVGEQVAGIPVAGTGFFAVMYRELYVFLSKNNYQKLGDYLKVAVRFKTGEAGGGWEDFREFLISEALEIQSLDSRVRAEEWVETNWLVPSIALRRIKCLSEKVIAATPVPKELEILAQEAEDLGVTMQQVAAVYRFIVENPETEYTMVDIRLRTLGKEDKTVICLRLLRDGWITMRERYNHDLSKSYRYVYTTR